MTVSGPRAGAAGRSTSPGIRSRWPGTLEVVRDPTVMAAAAASVGLAAALAPSITLIAALAVLAPLVVAAGLHRPRLALVVTIGLIVAYVPDALAAGTPVPGVEAAIAAPVAILVVRRLLGERRLAVPSEAGLFVALLLAMTVSALFSAERDVALAAIQRTAEFVVLAVVMLMLLDRTAWLRRAMWSVVIAAAALAALALVQQATRAYHVELLGLARVLEDRGIQRAAGPLDPNYFAMLLLSAGVLAFYLVLAARSARVRWAGLALLGTLLAGAAVTYSRGGAIALTVAVVLVVVLRKVRPWIPAAALACVFALALLFLPADVKQRFDYLLPSGETLVDAPRDESIANRYAENVVAFRMFRDRPLVGVGPGNYSPRYVPYALALGFDSAYAGGPLKAEQQEAHNLYLETLAELGAVGGLVLFAIFALALHAAWRARARSAGETRLLAEGTLIALVVVLTASVFLHNAYPRYLWIFLALALVAGRLGRAAPRSARSASAPRPGLEGLGAARDALPGRALA